MIGEAISGAIRELPRTPSRAIHIAWSDESIRTPVLIFLALRLFTALAILAMVQLVPAPLAAFMRGNPSGPTYFQALPMDSPFAQIVEPWHRWDTTWYVNVAIYGYHQGSPNFVFPPLYPVLIHILAPFCGWNYVLAAQVVTTVACFALFLLFFKLIEKEFGNRTLARNTLIVFAAFPTAYYLMAGYTESLFLALVLGAWLAALHKQWLLCGILAFFASLTRLQGIVICVPLAWIAYVQLRESGRAAILARLPAVLGAAVGTVSYYLYILINHIGTFDSAFKGEWQLYTRMPWDSVLAYIYRLQNHFTVDWEDRNAYALVFLLAMCIIVTFLRKPSFTLYSWLTLFVLLMRFHEGPAGQSMTQFESLIRYSFMMFPCFIAAGAIFLRWRQIFLIPYVLGGLYWLLELLNNFTHWKWVA